MTRVAALYPGRCACGCDVSPGDAIEYADGRVTGCEDCAWTGQRRRVADLSCLRAGKGGTLADAIRARKQREARKRAREDGHGR